VTRIREARKVVKKIGIGGGVAWLSPQSITTLKLP